MHTKTFRGTGELIQGHVLIESRPDLRMNGFETHRHFQLALDKVAESPATIAYKQRM